MGVRIMKYFFVLISICFAILPSYALSKIVHRVDIVGNQTISKEAIKAQLKTKKGLRLRNSTVIKDVRRLYDIGYFDRISVRSKTRKSRLIVVFEVKEKPRISSIVYKGHSTLSKKKLEEISELKMYEFLSIKKLQQGITNIKKGYEEKGYFLPLISYQIKSQKDANKIDLIIDIQEGKKALIQRIHFIGNNNISGKLIKSFLLNKEKNFLSFITDSGVYKQENLNRDQQLIRFLYMEKGYMEVKVEDPQVTLSPSKDGIYISFYISEGEQFKVGQMDFSGDLIFSKLELRKLLSLKTGDVFTYSFLQKDLMAIQTKYGDEGYAFANVIPRFSSQGQKEIHLLFDIQKGEKVYINRINISGNTVTRDRVLRREMKFFEGELYNASSILEAKKSIQRLGYIESIDILNDPLDSNTVDLEVSVKEREMLGQLQAGAGFDTTSGVTISGEFSRENIFGLGVTAGLQANIITTFGASKDSQYVYRPSILLNFQYIEPRLMDSDWYLGWNTFIEDTRATQCLIDPEFRGEPEGGSIKWSKKLQYMWNCIKKPGASKTSSSFIAKSVKGREEDVSYIRPYFIERTGTHLTFGRWLTNTSKLVSKLGIEYQLLSAFKDNIIEGFQLQEHSGARNILGGIFEYDGRDDRLFPTNGFFSNISVDHIYKWSSSNHLARMDWTGSHYVSTKTLLSLLPFSQSFAYSSMVDFLGRVVWKNKLQYGRVHSLNRGSIPVDLLYLLGGPHSLRGYRYYSVGKKIAIEGLQREVPYGGTQKFLYNLEMQFPILSKARLYGLAFFDMGYADDQLFTNWKTFLSHLKKDVGLGVMFITPMGPINLKWGIPISENYRLKMDQAQFHFSVGADF